MVSAAKLVAETKKTTLLLNLGELEVTYKPRLIVALQEKDEAEPEDEEEARNQQAEQICRVIIDWRLSGPVPIEDLGIHKKGSIFASDTEIIPLDPAIVRYLPFSLLSEIITAVSLDASPDPTSMLRRLRRRGSTGTSMSSNGRPDEPTLSQIG